MSTIWTSPAVSGPTSCSIPATQTEADSTAEGRRHPITKAQGRGTEVPRPLLLEDSGAAGGRAAEKSQFPLSPRDRIWYNGDQRRQEPPTSVRSGAEESEVSCG